MTTAELSRIWPLIERRFADITFTNCTTRFEVYIASTGRNDKHRDCIITGKNELIPISSISKIKVT